MSEPKYDEDLVNLGYLNKKLTDAENEINKEYENVSRNYGSRPSPPYYKGDTWIDGNTVYTCINTRTIGSYNEEDWTTESGAKKEAEKKNKIYLSQPCDYNAGDMWILQTDNDHKAGKKGEILITTAGRNEYDADDWVNMLGYGTIESINEVAGNLNNAINRIGNVEEAIGDGIIITFYQNTVPEAKHVGDLWYVTDTLEGYTKGKIYRYDGTVWQLLDDPTIEEAFEKANEARLVADGKIQSFYSDTKPTQDMGVGDLWIDTANNNQLHRYNGTNWVPVYDTRINDLVTDVSNVTERVTTVETDLGKIDLKVQENTTKVTTIENQIEETNTTITEMNEKIAQQKIETNKITNTVSEIDTKLVNDYLTAEQVEAEFDATKGDLEILKQKQVETSQTADDLQIKVSKIEEDGVSKVKTEKGFTFDDNGLTIDELNSKVKNKLDENGMEILDKTSGTQEVLLKAGYDATAGETIVKSKNMVVEKYLTIGANTRFEDYVNPTLGGKGTGAFTL